MPYTAQHKHETHNRILRSARRLFNRRGFAEVTIDEIMAEAGLTRGGFYKHFKSKDDLYSEAVLQFTCKDPPEAWQRKHVDPCAKGAKLARMIMDAYLSREHFEDRDGACPTLALPSDVSRSSAAVKRAFRKVLRRSAARPPDGWLVGGSHASPPLIRREPVAPVIVLVILVAAARTGSSARWRA